LGLIWTYQQNYHSTWKIWPSFSPGGRYAAVHDGNASVFVIDTESVPPVVEVFKIEIAFLRLVVLSLAVSDNKRQVALAAAVESPISPNGSNLIKYATKKPPVFDIIIVPSEAGRLPSLRYAKSGDSIFVAHLDVLSNRLSIEIFGTILGERKNVYYYGPPNNFLKYYTLLGDGAAHNDNHVAVDVIIEEGFELSWKSLISFLELLLRNGEPPRRRRSVWMVSSDPDGYRYVRQFDITSQAIIWQGNVVIIDRFGEIRVCDRRSRSTVTIGWTDAKVLQGRIVAFFGDRLASLGKDGTLSFAEILETMHQGV
jgi:hypothetical protein